MHFFISAFLKICINNLFYNLESGKRTYCFGKKSGKSLEFWIQKSVRTLCKHRKIKLHLNHLRLVDTVGDR